MGKQKAIAVLCLKYEGGMPPLAGPFLALDPSRYRKIVIYLKQNSDLPNPVEAHGCSVHYISKLHKFRVFNVRAIWRLVRILRKENVDILHCHRHQATVYGAIAAKLAGTKVVLAHVHGLNRSKGARRKLINHLVLRWVNRILAVGEVARQDVIACNHIVKPEQVLCVNNSVDCGRFSKTSVSRDDVRRRLGVRPDTFAFVAVGRLVPTKGLTYLIEALAATRKENDRCELFLVGEGRLRHELEALAASCGLKDVVHFLGFRKDVEFVLRGMDAFVMASVAEGMPGALLEAMASGLPCIATAVGGIPDVLEGGKLGILVPAEDSPALTRAMLEVASDAGAFGARAAAGREKVLQNYDHAALTRRLETVYETECDLAGTRCS